MVMELKDILLAVGNLPDVSLGRLMSCADEMHCRKGTMIIEASLVESDVFFIGKGIARAFVVSEKGREVTFWIGAEGTAVLSLNSYVSGRPGYENVQLMEDSVLYRLGHDDLFRMYEEDIHVANWGRRFAEREFLLTEERFIPLLFTTASKRYEHLLKSSPELLQRVPLEHLASWLGITPVSLSRIRAGIRL